jgi:Ni,Fe-hydrogenase III large subunit
MLTPALHETGADKVTEKCCELLSPVRDHEGRIRFHETARIREELDNLGRHMLLVQFDDGATTFLFPHEVVIQDC